MQIPRWTPELPFPVAQRHTVARLSDTLPAQTGKNEGVTSPSARRSRTSKGIIIRTAFTVLLGFLLLACFCHLSRGLLKSKSPAIRRLASSDEDEVCNDLLEIIGKGSKEKGSAYPSSQELLHSSEPVTGSASRKRKPSPNDRGEEAEHAKRPIFGRGTKSLSGGLQGDSDTAASSPWKAPSPNQPGGSRGVYQLSEGLSSRQRASPEDVSRASLTVTEDFFTGDDVEQWFLDYILDPSSGSLPGGASEHFSGTQQFTPALADDAVDTIHHSRNLGPQQHISVAHGQAKDDTHSLTLETQHLEGYGKPSGVSTDPDRASDSLQEYQSSFEHQPYGAVHIRSQGPNDASRPPVATTSNINPKATLVTPEDAFTQVEGVDPWLFDYILDSPLSSPPASGVGDSRAAHELGSKMPASQGQLGHESPSSFTNDTAEDGTYLPFREAPGVQMYLEPPTVSRGTTISSGKVGLHAGSVAAKHIPASKGIPLQAPQFVGSSAFPDSAIAPQASPSGSLPPTSQDQWLGILHSLATLEDEGPENHPFYRLPTASYSQNLIPFSFERVNMYKRRISLPYVLTPVQQLLAKLRLPRDDLQSLIFLSEKLVKIAFSMDTFPKGTIPLYEVQESVMRRFLIADALWSICVVVGSSMQKEMWWDQVMDILAFSPNVQISSARGKDSRLRLVRQFIAALCIYREGRRPSAEEVIELKREVLFSPDAPALFRARGYDKLRQFGTGRFLVDPATRPKPPSQ